MGQKTNPVGFRLGVSKDWRSRYYAGRELPKLLLAGRARDAIDAVPTIDPARLGECEARRAMRLFSEQPEGFGYLLKDRVLDVDDFLDSVRRVARGGTAIDPEVVAQLVGRRRPGNPVDELTERERAVLELMAEGRSNQGIGKKLFLSPKTVETHIHAIFRKLGLESAPDDHRRVLAVLAYLSR